MKITLKNNDYENKANDDDIKDHNIAIINEACRILSCIPGYLIKNIEGIMKTNKEYAEVIATNNIKKHEKQPTEHECVKADFEHAWQAVKEFEERGLYTKDGVILTRPSSVCNEFKHGNLWRKVELTAEQINERKINELAKVIWKSNPASVASDFCNDITPEWKFAYRVMAKSALEWMESKGE